jgi:hypothetical protein
MDRWTAEADIHTPILTEGKNGTEELDKLAGQQYQRDEHYDLHNYVVLDSLLKDHLNLQ